MAVNLDACIQCNLCVRACREVQVNDVIGMAGRGHAEKIVFDFDDPMGASTCVACGECVQACPTGALMPATLVDDNNVRSAYADREVNSVCPYCGVGCQLTYHIKDDKLLYVTGKDGPANHNRLCVKGRFGFDYVHNPERLVAADDPQGRRAARVSTTQSIRAIPGPISALPPGRKHLIAPPPGFDVDPRPTWPARARRLRLRQGLERRSLFVPEAGAHRLRLQQCRSLHPAVPRLLGRSPDGGRSAPAAVTATFNECKNSDVIVVIGANPTENHPVAATFFKQAAKRGAKLIVMDPRGQALKRHATHMLQFRNSTDVMMLNAILNVIITERLYDRQYVQTFTEGFPELAKHIELYTPEQMAPICGIDADTLRTVARTYARASSAIIFWGMGVSQHTHGTDNARCLIALALICGHVGRPGTGLHPLRGQNNVQGASDAGLVPMFFPDYRSVEAPEIRATFETAWGATLDPKKGLTVVEIMTAIHHDEIKGMYIMGENPAMSDPDLNHARAALAHLDHLVVQDLFLTETAAYADVVLPASAWPEKDGTVTNTNRQVQIGRRALPLPGEAKLDWWIIQEIARRIGLDWNYTHPSEIYGEMASLMPSLAYISWERIERENSVTYPSDAPDRPGHDVVFDKGFPRPGGFGRLVAAKLALPNEIPDDEFPMVLTTGRQLEHWQLVAILAVFKLPESARWLASQGPARRGRCDRHARWRTKRSA